MVNRARVRSLNQARPGQGPVIYWMSRDQRVRDNWALLYAQELALSRGQPLGVVFCLAPAFLGATLRQYGFMLKGLREVAGDLADLNLPFFLLTGEPARELPGFVANHRIGAVVSDFSPLRLVRGWKASVAEGIGVSLEEVDGHNIVPCWLASPKAEYGAYTLRPKLKKLLPTFLEDFPGLVRHPLGWEGESPAIPWDHLTATLAIDTAVPEVTWIAPGERQARAALDRFLDQKLPFYGERRNNPTQDGQSDLSPYLHFGHLAAQRVALEVEQRRGHDSSREAFLEELIVRRELADNFCFYQPHYDTFAGFPAWAQKTLNQHRGDRREPLYTATRWRRAGPRMSCGMQPSGKWSGGARCTAICVCTGPKKSWSGPPLRKRPRPWRLISMTGTSWMAGTPMAMPASPGVSAGSMTGPGSIAPCSARSGI